MNDGNRAICCSEGGESGVEGGERVGVNPDAMEGEGEGGSCTLFADDAFPLDLPISLRTHGCSAGHTNWSPAAASFSSQSHRS
jgi:hypothetical protein